MSRRVRWEPFWGAGVVVCRRFRGRPHRRGRCHTSTTVHRRRVAASLRGQSISGDCSLAAGASWHFVYTRSSCDAVEGFFGELLSDVGVLARLCSQQRRRSCRNAPVCAPPSGPTATAAACVSTAASERPVPVWSYVPLCREEQQRDGPATWSCQRQRVLKMSVRRVTVCKVREFQRPGLTYGFGNPGE
jgi:hypothetical protein